jgi:hypothetical protein
MAAPKGHLASGAASAAATDDPQMHIEQPPGGTGCGEPAWHLQSSCPVLGTAVSKCSTLPPNSPSACAPTPQDQVRGQGAAVQLLCQGADAVRDGGRGVVVPGRLWQGRVGLRAGHGRLLPRPPRAGQSAGEGLCVRVQGSCWKNHAPCVQPCHLKQGAYPSLARCACLLPHSCCGASPAGCFTRALCFHPASKFLVWSRGHRGAHAPRTNSLLHPPACPALRHTSRRAPNLLWGWHLTPRPSAAPQNCTAAQLISKKKNPHTATGALLEQSSFSDELSVVRASNNSRTAPEYNAGLIGEGIGIEHSKFTRV